MGKFEIVRNYCINYCVYLKRLRAALCNWNLGMPCSLTLSFEESK
jgi:hypothetical protein